MAAERPEDGPREAADEMEREADQMEEQLDELGDEIDEAEAAAERRPEAGSDLLGDVAGDWEDEAAGAQQGDDAVDAPRQDPDKRDADG